MGIEEGHRCLPTKLPNDKNGITFSGLRPKLFICAFLGEVKLFYLYLLQFFNFFWKVMAQKVLSEW